MNLLGSWRVDHSDDRALTDIGDVAIEFLENGRLNYTIQMKEKKQIIRLRYQIEGSTILTSQPSAPRVERTIFAISDDAVLTLIFDGVPYRFKREPL